MNKLRKIIATPFAAAAVVLLALAWLVHVGPTRTAARVNAVTAHFREVKEAECK